MPELCQMPETFLDALSIVDDDGVAAFTSWAEINKDGWDISSYEAIEQQLLDAKGHDSDAVYFALQHAPDAGLGFFRVVVRRADQDLITTFHCEIFKFLDQFREKGVGDLGDDQSEQAASA